MKNKHIRYPYEELEITASTEADSFNFTTPWAQVQVTFDPAYTNKVQSISQILKSEPDPNKLGEVSWLMEQVERFPFSYILPKNPIATPSNSNAKRPNVKEFLQSIGHSEIKEILNIEDEWEWDDNGALTFSQSAKHGCYDPVTLLTVCRRFHFLNFAEKDKSKELYGFVESLKGSPDKFKHACAIITRQNHYVTARCNEVLTPALRISGVTKDKVQDFINSEKGHDKILYRAVKSLGGSPNNLPVSESLKQLMDIFKIASSKNFLAFALIVDMFEGNSYEEKSFFAEFLLEHGFDEAAKQLYIHRNINHEGEHDNIGIDFLSDIEPPSQEDVLEAMCYAEIISILINNISGETLKLLQELEA